MTSSKSNLPYKYLHFDRYHAATWISALTPGALKSAAKRIRNAYRGENTLKPTFTLNHIANTLGFRAFSGFITEYENKLPQFMKEHGLRARRDVLAAQARDTTVRLNYRQVADRLFSSGKPRPKAIFVGGKVECWDLLKAADARDDMKVVSTVWPGSPGMSFKDAKSVPFAPHTPPNAFAILSQDGELRLGEISYFNNLIGEQLCAPFSVSAEDVVSCIYGQGGTVPTKTQKRLAQAARILRKLLSCCPTGWVEVIPYNERLCFLKAPDGGYEFVFKNLRSEPFAPDLAKDRRLESLFFQLDERDQFTVRTYFDYAGWEERDLHLAERAFYENGGTQATYPGSDAIFREHLKKTGWFLPEKRTAPPTKGFSVAQCSEKLLCFSELVTIADFHCFMKEWFHYKERRQRIKGIESWASSNHMADAHLPAAVTWFDAKEYARWFGQVNRLPVRLATEGEYLALANGLAPQAVSGEELAEALHRPLGRFFDPHGVAFDGTHPPYMDPLEFDRWGFRYDPSSISWVVSNAGMKVMQSARFGEWLQMKGAAINSQHLCSQYDICSAAHVPVSAERGLFTATSTGKYKGMKIGFRLVYEANIEGGE